MHETLYFADRDLANRYVRTLGLLGFVELENTPNDHGGRMVVYRGTKQQLAQPVGPLFVVLLAFSIVGLAVWVLWRFVSANQPVLRTVVYRPWSDPNRDATFEVAADSTAELPEVKRLAR